MIVDRDYIEERAMTLYDETHPIKLFRDESVRQGPNVLRIRVANDPPTPGMVAEDDDVPCTEMTYDEEEVRMRFFGAEYDKRMTNPNQQEREMRAFDENFVHSFTGAIHQEVTDKVETEQLDYDTPNGILFEGMIEGRMALLERTHAEPDAMLVADTTAENIIEDSVFEEWEPIARDIEQEFGVDVYHDQFNALYSNEVLLVDTGRFGVQYHEMELYAEDRFDSIRAGMKGGFKITDPDAGIRLTT